MAENKTRVTDASVPDYLSAIADAGRRQECEALAAFLEKVTGEKPRMWGDSIVGFGSYYYRYASGREGDCCVVGFSSRVGGISLYGLGDVPVGKDVWAKFGKHKRGKSCVNVRKLSDIDLGVLEKLMAAAWADA